MVCLKLLAHRALEKGLVVWSFVALRPFSREMEDLIDAEAVEASAPQEAFSNADLVEFGSMSR